MYGGERRETRGDCSGRLAWLLQMSNAHAEYEIAERKAEERKGQECAAQQSRIGSAGREDASGEQA